MAQHAREKTNSLLLYDGPVTGTITFGPVFDLDGVIPSAFVLVLEPSDDCIILPTGGPVAFGKIKVASTNPFPLHDDKQILTLGTVYVSGSAGGSEDGVNTVPSYDPGIASFVFDTRIKMDAFAVKFIRFETNGGLVMPGTMAISLYWKE